MTLTEFVARRLDALAPAGARCLVAVSGGPDSLALLDLLWQGRALHQRELAIGHVDHGIDPRSRAGTEAILRWLERGPELPLHRAELALGPGASETTARRARQTALRALAEAAGAEVILLGHHADDQAETILLRVLKGSGPAGLAGMSPRRGIWIRPLLSLRRSALGRHLEEAGVPAWSDPANHDPRHLRSWLRHAVFPVLERKLPDLTERLENVGTHATAARRGWDDLVEALPDLSLQQEMRGISVAAPPLERYSSALRGEILAAIGRRFGVPLGERRLRVIEELLEHGLGTIHLSGELEAELAFGRLIFRGRDALAVGRPDAAVLTDGLTLGNRRFGLRREPAGVVERTGWSTWLAPGDYRLRGWRGGDRIRPLGGHGTRPVGVLLKEARVAPGERPYWPVVTRDDDATVLWVPGICRSADHVPVEGADAIHAECREA